MIKQTLQKTTTCLLVGVISCSPLLVLGQVQGVSGQPSLGGIEEAFRTGVGGTIESISDSAESAIDSTFSGIETGNVITDGIINGDGSSENPGVAGVAASALSCVAGAALAGIGQQAAGLVPTADSVTQTTTGGNFQKECLLDGIGFQLKEALIKGVLQGMINYVNNGFDGGPAYVQNQDQYFNDLQDQQFDEFVNNPANFSSLCSAWESDVRLALATQYTTAVAGGRVTQLSGTGTGVNNTVPTGQPATCAVQSDGYATDASSDYWGDFLNTTTKTGGNAVTSFFAVEEQFSQNLQNEVDKKLRELDQNNGFLNVTYCDDDSDSYDEVVGAATEQDKVIGTSRISGKDCLVTTPGVVIEQQLHEALASDQRRLELADEFDELFSALIGQLIKSVFNKSGLFGVSQRTGGSRSLIDEYADSVNETAVIASRDELLRQLENYQGATAEYIGYKQQSINQLFQGRDAILDTLACYESKYDTWVNNLSWDVIPADQVDSTPEASRTRATFFRTQTVGSGDNQTVTTTYLTPTQSGEKVAAYNTLLDEMTGYILDMQTDIEAAELDIDEVTVLKIQMEAIDGSEEPLAAALADSAILQRIASEFAGTANTVTVALDDGTFVEIPQNLSTQQVLEVYIIALEELTVYSVDAALEQNNLISGAIDDLLNGVPLTNGQRAPGLLSDLQQCQGFSRVFDPTADDDD